jgi:hypothetical protein
MHDNHPSPRQTFQLFTPCLRAAMHEPDPAPWEDQPLSVEDRPDEARTSLWDRRDLALTAFLAINESESTESLMH